MKKFLVLASILLALTLVFAACGGDDPTETTGEDVTVADPATDAPTEAPTDPSEDPTDDSATEEPTEVPSEEPTEVPSEEPTDEVPTEEPTQEPETLPYKEPSEAGQVNASFDTFYVNGSMYFEADGGAGDKLTAQDNTVTFELGAAHDSMMLRGWIGFGQAIDSFGYYINTYDFVYGDFAREAESDVKNAGGEHASRFEITVPLADLGVGEHKVGFIVKLADGTVVLMRAEVIVAIKGLEVATDIKFHTSVDHVNAAGPNGDPHYSGRGGNSGNGCDVIDGAADGKSVGEDMLLSIGGWAGVDGGINRYVWSVDGVNWFDVQSGGRDGEPVEGHYTGIGLTDALKNGMYNGESFLIANLSAYEGQTVDVTFAAVPESAQDKVIPFVKITGLTVYDLPNDTEKNFQSNVESNFAESTDNVDLKNSDLKNLFETMLYGAGETVYAVKTETGAIYRVNSFTSLQTNPNGLYAFTINVTGINAEGFGSFFVRGIQNASPEKQFFGQDGNDAGAISHGGAGIFLNVTEKSGQLCIRINVKSYVDGAYVPNIYYAPINSRTVTVADDGKNVYIISDGKLAATIAISGTADYALDGVPADASASKVVVTLANDEVYEIENAIVAASFASDLGVATRTGTVEFDYIALAPLSSVEIPTEYFVPVVKESIALGKPVNADSVEDPQADGYQNLPEFATDGKEETRWGAQPNGEANLTVDLEAVYTLEEIKVYFENASWNHTVSVSTDGVTYEQVYAGEPHGAGWISISLDNVDARYIKFTRLEDDGASSYWFSIYELYVYAAESDEGGEDTPTTESIVIDPRTLPAGSITGHEPNIVDSSNTLGHYPMVAAAGLETAAMIHAGSIYIGEYDLTKIEKIVIYYATDWGEGTQAGLAAAKEQGFGYLGLCAIDCNNVINPDRNFFIGEQYTPAGGWAITAHELPNVAASGYSGPVYVSADFLGGQFIIIDRIEIIYA